MALTMEAPKALEGHEDDVAVVDQPADKVVDQVVDQPATEAISVDEANAELTEIGRETQNEIGQAEADAQADDQANQIAVIDDDEKRFWATIAIKAKLADCGRDIRMAESKIDHLKMQIKEEKEFLKGEQIRLTRLAGDLADIIDGHPLPKDPNAKPEPKDAPKLEGPAASIQSDSDDQVNDNMPNWRVMETGQLLDGLKGLGKKKLESLVDAAPTAGDLEDLRGEASRAHKHFREVLPDGFGEKIADAIEERLLDHVSKAGPSAEQQAAAERGIGGDEPLDIEVIAKGIRTQLKRQKKDAKSKDEFVPEDTSDLDDPFVDGWLTFLDGTPIDAVDGAETATDELSAREWLSGWLTSEMVHDWDEKPSIAGKIEQRERDQINGGSDDQYEDVADDDVI